jgi:glycosidase
VHGNYKEINVENEDGDKDSLLNVIRALGKIRKEEAALREGSLELMEGLPNGVLGYVRKLGGEKITILLNFDSKEKQFELESAKCAFKLSPKDEIKNKAICLDGFGGMMLR